MSDTTTIEWTATRLPDGTVLPGYTFNPWRGCKKVSPACAHCYAETLSKRNPRTLGSWEAGKPRVMAAESYMRRPFLWNAAAEKSGIRMKVFCSSLADVFEEWHGPVAHVDGTLLSITLDDLRKSLLGIIDATPWLDWLLLTKRPENVTSMLRRAGREELPANVWMGATVENQQLADQRIPALLNIPAKVRFLSCEPLLGPVNLDSNLGGTRWIGGQRGCCGEHHGIGTADCPRHLHHHHDERCRPGIDWLIAGGESGSKARPSHPDWFRSLRDQCQAAGTSFFFKQWGEWAPRDPDDIPWEDRNEVVDKDGDFVIDTFGRGDPPGSHHMALAGKKAAGRRLDGIEWNQVPEPAIATLA